MNGSDLLVLSHADMAQLLQNQEKQVIALVREAYIAQSNAETSLPFSTFLRFPDQPRDRIIGLPAYIGGKQPVAGIKWVASFPENLDKGLERASAVLILNHSDTGRAYCVMEASLVNISRTAASAALAAMLLSRGNQSELSLIGCGPINMAICRYILLSLPSVQELTIFDTDNDRAELFKDQISKKIGKKLAIRSVKTLSDALRDKCLISIATSALTPTITERDMLRDDALLLHVSLRDIDPEIIYNSYNVVDDLEHVNREKTSIHLASKQYGNTDFVHGTIGDIAQSPTDLRDIKQPIIFSPFGLGVLDLKLAQYIYTQAAQKGIGQTIPEFLPS